MNNSQFQFGKLELKEIEFRVNNDFNSEIFEGILMNTDTKIKKLDSDKAEVCLTLHVGTQDSSQPFDIHVKMQAEFSWESTMDGELVDSLLRTNAPAVLISYMRPMISSMTSNSCYPTLNIPFIDFTENEDVKFV